MFKRVFTLILLLLVITLLCGCSTQLPAIESSEFAVSNGIKDAVTVVVTRDFGKEVLLEETVEIEPDTTAMDALQSVAEVQTKYGGGFVSSINGVSLKCGRTNKKDWFFYINGVSSNVGARDYILQDGDIEHWDFRDWSYHHFVPAVIGDFPQPFRSGYMGKAKATIVVYEEEFTEEARLLVGKLRAMGITETSAIVCDQLPRSGKEQSNLILLAGPDNEFIAELNQAHRKLGFYSYIEHGEIISLDAEGNLSGDFGAGCGLIQATQNPWNPKGIGAGENVVWMVTGTDSDGVRSAVSALTYQYNDLRYACATVISEGRIIKIP